MAARKRLLDTLERYFARQIYGAVGFVLLGFLLLFMFQTWCTSSPTSATATIT